MTFPSCESYINNFLKEISAPLQSPPRGDPRISREGAVMFSQAKKNRMLGRYFCGSKNVHELCVINCVRRLIDANGGT